MRIPELSCNRIIYMTFIKQQYKRDKNKEENEKKGK